MRGILLPTVCLIVATPTLAQSQPVQTGQIADDQEDPHPPQQLYPIQAQPTQAGRIAESSVGIIGQRQSREQTTQSGAPMDRIENRIQNRVQSRIRNRIDRNYDPQANVTSPFAVAEDKARSLESPRR